MFFGIRQDKLSAAAKKHSLVGVPPRPTPRRWSSPSHRGGTPFSLRIRWAVNMSTAADPNKSMRLSMPINPATSAARFRWTTLIFSGTSKPAFLTAPSTPEWLQITASGLCFLAQAVTSSASALKRMGILCFAGKSNCPRRKPEL